MRFHVRDYALAFLVATIAALAVDVVLQLSLEAVSVSPSNRAPWWVTGNLVGRGRWVVFAWMLWLVSRRLSGAPGNTRGPASGESVSEAWRHVAAAVIGVPFLWILATWLVSAVRFTALGTWASDGRVFLAPDYYRAMVLDLAPWLLAAATTAALARHVDHA